MSASQADDEAFEMLMRRHDMDVLPEARDAARHVFSDLTRAVRLVRQERAMTNSTAHVFSPGCLLRHQLRPDEADT